MNGLRFRRSLPALALAFGLSPMEAPPAVAASTNASVAAAKPAATPKAQSRTARKRTTTPPPSARPDRSLYQAAESAKTRLMGSTRLRGRQSEWDKVVGAYRNVVHRYPRSPYCDDSLLKAGDLQREMARRFKSSRYLDQALTSYGLVVSEYPGSSLGEAALFATYEILLEQKHKTEALAIAAKYLDAYPDGMRAKVLTRAVSTPKTKAAPRAGRTAQVSGVRSWSGEASTRVVIDLDRKVEIKSDRLESPPRLFVDLIGARLHPNLVDKVFPVGNEFLKQIRIGLNRENVVRVVVDFEEATGHNVFFLADPDRLVIDVQGRPRSGTTTATNDSVAASPPVAPPARPASRPPVEVMDSVEVTQQVPVLPEAPETAEAARPATPAATPPSIPTPVPLVDPPAPKPRPEPTSAPSPAAQAPASPPPTGSASPARNEDGNFSLARQLGLGARRICLDAGHGGHDPGSIGRAGTQEKDLTLAVVMKLEKLIRTKLGADVVLTRDSDVFIPLEERTAIANASGADLFLSVHINSARNRTGRGLETYYLSFAKSAAAEAIAARENAISQATMKDLNNLVKAIATNSKIDESRDFAGIIQKSNVRGLSPSFKGLLDRGVHTAPFYVLIGANMPSVLTEVGFISNPEEERWLKSEAYQDKLAESLLEGVRSYLNQINRSQTTKLDGRNGVRIPAKRRAKR